ncbi:hypothetical protein CYMTET_13565 [Cymbomonas tetramitiformis]|uniref:Uncharacterized protein n=1 Tax=Cymbomonas tetramitiformis TaxID=36881 RepID=A0AAE0GI97_9CHLO|nr:hypothetical protein CYMTET_13565 [Cymbomonas tetramitiformis]
MRERGMPNPLTERFRGMKDLCIEQKAYTCPLCTDTRKRSMLELAHHVMEDMLRAHPDFKVRVYHRDDESYADDRNSSVLGEFAYNRLPGENLVQEIRS